MIDVQVCKKRYSIVKGKKKKKHKKTPTLVYEACMLSDDDKGY